MNKHTHLVAVLTALLLLTVAAHAASPRPAWGKHVMVSTSERYATEVGAEILTRGGNAVDAAAAVALALGVTEGYASGIGGGCFILIRLSDGSVFAIDGRETAPAKAGRLMFVSKDTTKNDLATAGVLAAGTPGELAALELAVRTCGKLPFASAFDGAIALADTGFDVSMRYARALKTNADLLRRFEGTKAIFFKNDTLPLEFGDRLVQNDLAQTLRKIQTAGIGAFYNGDIPMRVDVYVKANGGVLNARDFASYMPVVREPLHGSYDGFEILSMPPPSSGGVHVIEILNLLEPYRLRHLGAGSSESVHLIAEAMQIAFADRAEYLGDPDFVRVPTAGLVTKDYADERRRLIDRLQHLRLDSAGNPWAFAGWPQTDSRERHTTHLCVVDSFGNAVSLTATINTTFGCGVVVPGTGFLLNNEMDDFVTKPGQPNYFGLVGNQANEIEPGKRPLSSMSPTILVKDNRPFLIIGSMGGPRIITSVVLAILNLLNFEMNVQEAIDFPRVHQQWRPDLLYLEPEFAFDVLAALRDRGHTVRMQTRWAATTAIQIDTTYGGWWGAADSRVDGLAKGF